MIAELIFKDIEDITICQYIKSEEREKIPADSKGYRILKLKKVLFIIESDGRKDLEGCILISSDLESIEGYCCWEIEGGGLDEIFKGLMDKG